MPIIRSFQRLISPSVTSRLHLLCQLVYLVLASGDLLPAFDAIDP